MRPNRNVMVVGGIILLLLVLATILILILRSEKFYAVKIPSVHDRVTTVVQAWAHLTTLPTDKQELEVLWPSGPQFEFFPYGAQDLTTRLQNEFRDSKQPVLLFTDVYATNNPTGKVKTVDQLATAVRLKYRPR